MKTETNYYCEKCERSFDTELDCLKHEEKCGHKNTFTCDKCGKQIQYTSENECDDGYDFSYNECWILHPNHYRVGYGSKLDGCEFKLQLCDDCLVNFIDTFKNNEHIYNSGSNFYYPADYEEDEE